jgi:cell division transport system permease protein
MVKSSNFFSPVKFLKPDTFRLTDLKSALMLCILTYELRRQYHTRMRCNAMTRRLHLLIYFVREALINMTRNRVLNGITIGMIAVSLTIFGLFLLIYVNLNAVVKRWSTSVQIIAYLNEDSPQEQHQELADQIRAIEYVESVQYVSKEAALTIFEQRLANQAYLLEGLETNPLPASYEIHLKRSHRDLESVRQVVETLQEMQPFEDIQYGQTWLENLTLVINMLRFIGVFLGLFLFLTVVFIVSNTIKLTLYSREEELTIMKFIGATESFIQGPFVVEGVIRGFLGAAASVVLLYIIHRLFLLVITYSSQTLLMFSAISFLSWTMLGGLLILGSVLGWCGSLLTLHKYLKTY